MKLQKDKNIDSKKRSILKSVCWRIIGVFVLFGWSYLFTRSFPQTTGITIVHHSVFLVIFWLHERLWFKIGNFNFRPYVKAFCYEIVIAIPILSFIGWMFTGNFMTALKISISYTLFKLVLYVFFEKLWLKYVTNREIKLIKLVEKEK